MRCAPSWRSYARQREGDCGCASNQVHSPCLASAGPPAPTATSFCSDRSGNCYFYEITGVSQSSAATACLAKAMRLASFSSWAEQLEVEDVSRPLPGPHGVQSTQGTHICACCQTRCGS